ncbi:uncharacterized protein LOC129762186 [Toxorhynchites rutilus septentrionalis]|uniref:uncharacterized protein LOC129762186 n=1 Tax=Toxorhynchites rutilus septentrionalis TaxID=329112 RepID=UPI00247A95D0|nr:uncharacterized protein LOC129762186 [Toxorhynchites rutilus septentrionalis]
MRLLLGLTLSLGIICNAALAHYSGPFLLWGVNELKDIEVPALGELDDKFLRDVYSSAAAVVVFLRNGTTKLNDDNFPSFRRIIEKHEYVYSSQQELVSNPLDYNVNAEIINLVGSPSQQDVELSALYRDSVGNYGERKVLGILANRWDEPHHGLHKREANGETVAESASSTTPAAPTEEPEIDDAIYLVYKKGLIYINSPPRINTTDGFYTLNKHTVATSDSRGKEFRIDVKFQVEDTIKLTLKFRFDIGSGYWTMPKVDVELIDTKNSDWTKNYELDIEGDAPYAPTNFSYSCSRPLVFRNGTTVLTLENIQVQPTGLNGTRFGPAWDCIGFTTVPIWSGIFVTTIMAVALAVAICAILDIKPPNRFESRTGKQLTFTVQE